MNSFCSESGIYFSWKMLTLRLPLSTAKCSKVLPSESTFSKRSFTLCFLFSLTRESKTKWHDVNIMTTNSGRFYWTFRLNSLFIKKSLSLIRVWRNPTSRLLRSSLFRKASQVLQLLIEKFVRRRIYTSLFNILDEIKFDIKHSMARIFYI